MELPEIVTADGKPLTIYHGMLTLVGANATGKTCLLREIKQQLGGNKLADNKHIQLFCSGRIANLERFKSCLDPLQEKTSPELKADSPAFSAKRNNLEQIYRDESLTSIFHRLIDRPDLLIKIKERLNKYLNKELYINWEESTLDIKFTDLYTDTQYKHSAGREASGLLHLMGLLIAIYDDQIGALLIDEPEVSLHPQLQSFLYKELQQAAGQPEDNSYKKIIVIVTHSTEMLRIKKASDICNLAFCNGFQQPPTQLKQGDDCLDGKTIKKAILDISQTNKQIFFCKKPFIVEGRPDQIICEVLADKVQVALEPAGVQTLVLTGVNKILPTYQLLSLLSKTPIMLVDADAVADGTSLINAILDKNEEAIKNYDAKSGQAPIRARILELYTEFDQKNHDKLLKDLIQQTVIYPCYNYYSEIYENGLNDEDQEDKEILFRKRLGFCLLFNVPTLSIEDKALKLRFETMLEEMEKFGLFVLKKGSIESYYQKTELRKDGASKIDEAIIEADYIIEEMELSQITKNYPEIINCLKYSTFITPICECNLVKEWLRTICFTLQSALVEKKTQDYQAKIFDLIGDKAKLFIVHATEAALTIDINSTILDVVGFPIEITHEDDANEIDKKIEQIKARGSR